MAQPSPDKHERQRREKEPERRSGAEDQGNPTNQIAAYMKRAADALEQTVTHTKRAADSTERVSTNTGQTLAIEKRREAPRVRLVAFVVGLVGAVLAGVIVLIFDRVSSDGGDTIVDPPPVVVNGGTESPDSTAEPAVFTAGTCFTGGRVNGLNEPVAHAPEDATASCNSKHTGQVIKQGKAKSCQAKVDGWTRWTNRIIATSVVNDSNPEQKLCMVALNLKGELESIDYAITNAQENKKRTGACAGSAGPNAEKVPSIPDRWAECGSGRWLHYSVDSQGECVELSTQPGAVGSWAHRGASCGIELG